MDIELAFLSKIITTGEFKEVLDNKITENFFYGKGKPIFNMMADHYREYRKTPSLEAIKREFPDFEFQEIGEPLEYFIDQIRDRHKYNVILTGIQHIADLLQGDSLSDAELELYRLTSRVTSEIKVSRDINYAQRVEDRIKSYEYKKRHCGVDGIPTLIPPLDNITGGAHPGELITILGQAGTGKTWIEMVIARNALREGYRVLFVTKEMEPEQIAQRMDAALLELPFDQIRRGLLGDDLEQEYFRRLRELQTTFPDFIISGDDGEGGLTPIQGKVEEYSPDLLIIDGSYLIVDEDGGKSQWERATNITRRLKRMARKLQIPIYNATQAVRSVSRKTAPGMEDIAFTYAYSQDSDIIISIYRTPEMVAASKLGLKLAKVRDGDSSGHYVLNWDFKTMKGFGTLASDLTELGPDEEESTIIY